MNKRTLWFPLCMRLFPVIAAVTMGLSSLAHAGAGIGASTDITGAPKIVPTYYANSPSGIWTDWAGNVHDSGGFSLGLNVPGGGLRKFVDPLPNLCGPPGTVIPAVAGGGGTPLANKCIPVANPQASPVPGEGTNVDYYEIGVVEYTEPMHADLPNATKLRGYIQLNDPNNPVLVANGYVVSGPQPHYLGPLIIAQRFDALSGLGAPGNGKPVRIKYTNLLPIGAAGNLFIPVDKTLMGAGLGPNLGTETYTENRTGVHLHGGDNPWISDGTPHQWTIPVGETSSYMTGASFANVPDMADPGQGSGTLYYPNGDSGRLMFYHEHAAGITRLNVYAGVAAGYLLVDPNERALTDGSIPGTAAVDVPLVIQERTFVPKDIAVQDARWNKDVAGNPVTVWGGYGDLWYPHVYETNQDPFSFDGTNPVGRWDYGPWFWPVFSAPEALPTGFYGDASTTPEAFGDTPIVNGTAYPTVTVNPVAYRFRILNAINDRSINLGLYTADPTVTSADGRTNTEVRMVPFIGPNTVTGSYACPPSGMTDISPYYPISFPCAGGLQGTGWGQQDNRPGGVPDPKTAGPNIWQIGTEGGLLPQVADIPSTIANFEYNKRSVTVLNVLEHGLFLMPAERADAVIDFSQFPGQTLIMYNDAPSPVPAGDPRIDYYTGNPDLTAVGGAPSTMAGFGPNTRTMMQIKVGVGTHTGAGTLWVTTNPTTGLPDYSKTFSILNGGIGYSLATTTVTISDGVNTDTGTPVIGLGGVITAITPNTPGTLYTSAPKVTITDTGVQPGIGAVALAYLTPAPAYDLTALKTALPAAYAATQPRPIVAQAAYGAPTGPYPSTFPDQFAHIYTGASLQPTVTWVDGNGVSKTYSVPGANPAPPVVDGFIYNKAIQELFDPHGRMNATLGVELPFTSALNQTTIPLAYIDPATETVKDGETQIWKITHNGVDSHPVHFHLINVQVINRVGWDGTIKPPYDNELGWKETVRMNPLEDIIVAVRAKSPKLPFSIGNSNRYLDPTQPPNVTTGFTQVNPATGNPAVVTNIPADFGWEYVWHCHILGHEENDFMRPFILTGATNYNFADTLAPVVTAIVSPAPNAAGWNSAGTTVTLSAVDNPPNPCPGGAATCQYLASGVASITYSINGAPNVTVAGGTVTIPVTAEGITSISFFATDKAAVPNASTPQVQPVKVDVTKPTLTWGASAPAANANGWNNTVPVTLPYTTADNLSGVASATPASPLTFAAQGANLTQSVTVTDNAGNSAIFTSPVVKIDTTPPTITGTRAPAANALGWNNANVTVTFTAIDALSGVATLTAPVVVSTEGANQSVTGTATDLAGNSSSVTVSGISIDKTAPTVSATASPASANRGGGTQAVTVSGTVTDLLSGPNATANNGTYRITDSKSATVLTGTFTVAANGTYSFVRNISRSNTANTNRIYTFTVTARDQAGNPASATTTFTVR